MTVASLCSLSTEHDISSRPVQTHPASHGPAHVFVGPRGTRVNMLTTGTGSPVLAVHGSGMQGAMWRSMQPSLGDDFRLYCPDLYGYGRSEALPMPQRMTLDDNAGLIATLLRRFERPVHLLGHAFGAAVALRAVLDHPGRVASLTLYEPLALHLLKPEFGGHAPAQRQMEALAADMRMACLRGESHIAARLFYDHCSGPGAFETLSQPRRAHLATHAPRLCLDIAMAFNARQPLSSYAGLKMPVLLLSGTASPGGLQLIAERLAGTLPAARHAILPDLGHFAPASQPEAVARAIRPFLLAREQAALRACA